MERDYNLEPIENYGVTGTWFLEMKGIDPRKITSLGLKFVVSMELFDQNLETRVEQLVQNYEDELAEGDALDRITAYSTRQRFPDAFFQLETGQGTLVLHDDDFDPTYTDLKVKTVVCQALDQDKAGVEGIAVEISKPGTSFSLARTTGVNGFSEDVSAEIPVVPPPDRPPIQGTWQIRLPEPAQFAKLGDLQLFFVYEYKEQ